MLDGEEVDGRVRVFCDPRPPKKGRVAKYERYLRQHQVRDGEKERGDVFLIVSSVPSLVSVDESGDGSGRVDG